MRTAPVGVSDRVRHDRRRQERERFGVLFSLLRIRVAAARWFLALALLRFVVGGRHSLRLRADDLLHGERVLVLEIAHAREDGSELRLLIGELLLKLEREIAPFAAVLFLGGQ